MMEAQGSASQGGRLFNGLTILLASAFLLPGLAPSLFGWISGLISIPIFWLLNVYGLKRGTIIIRNSAILAAVVGVFSNLLPSVLFSLTLVPLGYSFNKSATIKENEITTCGKGVVILSLTWVVFWIGYGTVEGVNLYSYLLELLDAGFAQTYDLYRENSDVPAQTLLNLEGAVTEIRLLIPRILPGILVCTVLLTVWINLVGSISLLERIKPGQLPWKKFKNWRLPERLVWLPIVASIALIVGQGEIKSTGLSLIIISALLYFFQGFAVLIHFIDKWKVPLYLKIAIYGILILQSYGLLLLSVIGIADVWIDFRRRRNSNDETVN